MREQGSKILHSFMPSLLKVPGKQSPEHVDVVAPDVLPNEPLGQIAQSLNKLDPSRSLYRPMGQIPHSRCPIAVLNDPLSQSAHAALAVCPASLLYVPVGQSSHDADPRILWYLPLPHISQANTAVDRSFGLALPAWHSLHPFVPLLCPASSP